MQKCRLTVFFEAPFWVCVCERAGDGVVEACKITFGSEPRDGELYEFFLENWHQLRFSPPVGDDPERDRNANPKRMQREISRQLAQTGVGTKAQQALKLQQAEGKAARKKASRREREEEKARRFARKQAKKKQKHRGH